MDVELRAPDLALLDAALAGDDALADALGARVAPGWVSFPDALRHARDQRTAGKDDTAWSTRFFLADGELVGWGGFKGPPGDTGTVELGYEIAPDRRERGLATAATRAMLAEAWADPRVSRVIAHTLPEPNASTRVLQKAGFRFDGDAVERGTPVWRWAHPRNA